MTITYVPEHFADVFQTKEGAAIWAFLNEHDSIVRMETATYLRRPAVEPLSPVLERRIGEPAFADRIKQMTGHMIRQVMEAHGYRFDRGGVRITTLGNRYTSGARYVAL